jgi:hypothetical protein
MLLWHHCRQHYQRPSGPPVGNSSKSASDAAKAALMGAAFDGALFTQWPGRGGGGAAVFCRVLCALRLQGLVRAGMHMLL